MSSDRWRLVGDAVRGWDLKLPPQKHFATTQVEPTVSVQTGVPEKNATEELCLRRRGTFSAKLALEACGDGQPPRWNLELLRQDDEGRREWRLLWHDWRGKRLCLSGGASDDNSERRVELQRSVRNEEAGCTVISVKEPNGSKTNPWNERWRRERVLIGCGQLEGMCVIGLL
jgi:hypothetical protein